MNHIPPITGPQSMRTILGHSMIQNSSDSGAGVGDAAATAGIKMEHKSFVNCIVCITDCTLDRVVIGWRMAKKGWLGSLLSCEPVKLTYSSNTKKTKLLCSWSDRSFNIRSISQMLSTFVFQPHLWLQLVNQTIDWSMIISSETSWWCIHVETFYSSNHLCHEAHINKLQIGMHTNDSTLLKAI